jgi:predicted regulator of Ras-like GTPase activity (Roadblock/LC7/MglB family)
MATLPQLIEEDVRELGAALEDLLADSEATLALIIDKGGFLIIQSGRSEDFDTTTLAALAAGSYAATESIAGLVGETTFSSVYQQGDKHSLLVVNVDRYCLLGLVFKARVSVGAVKYFALEATRRIAAEMDKAHNRAPAAGFDLSALNMADATPLFTKRVA